jgi:DNA-binding transcriptional ArsR family regulator
MQNAQAATMARCLKTLSDPNRIRILRILARGEFCVSDLVAQLQVDQPKVSHHLAILRSAGIIRCRRDGRHINYSLFPSVHRRRGGAPGDSAAAVDEFNLGDISVCFSFVTEDGATAASAESGTVRIRVGDTAVAASSAAVAPAAASGSAAPGAAASS